MWSFVIGVGLNEGEKHMCLHENVDVHCCTHTSIYVHIYRCTHLYMCVYVWV